MEPVRKWYNYKRKNVFEYKKKYKNMFLSNLKSTVQNISFTEKKINDSVEHLLLKLPVGGKFYSSGSGN